MSQFDTLDLSAYQTTPSGVLVCWEVYKLNEYGEGQTLVCVFADARKAAAFAVGGREFYSVEMTLDKKEWIK